MKMSAARASSVKRQAATSGSGPREGSQEDNPELGKIDYVLGMTVFSNSSLACHSDAGLVAYPAGSVLILLDCLRNRQDSCIHTPRKMITAVCFSPDGKLVATGESGHQPSVRVWRLSTMTEIACLDGHHVGISCLSFTRQMTAIVVVGDAYDMVISVWSWPQVVMLCLNKFADRVCAMDISSDGDFFVTVGSRHVKFYCMEMLRSPSLLISKNVPVPLPTRCGMLDNLKDNYFCDVACGLGTCADFIYVISSTGMLCQLNRDRMLKRWVNVNVTMATCLARDEVHLFVGCDGGIVRMFQASDLKIVITLPLPHRLGLDIAQLTEYSDPVPKSGGDCRKTPDQPEYPSVRAMAYDHCSHQLTVIYDDSSIYIWRRRRCGALLTFHKCYSSLYHCGCIWDLTLYPLSDGSTGGALPPGALLTVSADGTLRAWDVASIISERSMLKRNVVSTNCLKIVYSQADRDAGREKARQMKRLRGDAMSPAFQRESREAFGVVAVCPEGVHIATGNRHGRVMVYDAHSMKLLATRFAHDTEVTALSYATTQLYKILASGSRDRMIHLMDALNNYHLLATLDDHSSSITAIHFTYISQCLLMVSSSLDMSVLVRAYLDNTPLSFNHVRAIVEKKAVVDFTMHPWSGQIALVCQDKLVRIYSLLNSHKSSNTYRGCPAQGGSLIKISMDPSGQYLLTACTNKTINLIEFNTGEILHTFSGHAESITRIRFAHNLRHVISSASDGCIFMWQLPQTVAYSVKKVMAEMGLLTRGMVLNSRWKKTGGEGGVCRPRHSSFPRAEPRTLTDARRLDAIPVTRSYSAGAMVTIDDDMGSKVRRSPVRQPSVHAFDRLADDADQAPPQVDGSSDDCDRVFGNNSKRSAPFSSKKGPHSAEWLKTCTHRRHLFKVEAKSIKRILSMMRLVADAMEKDLQDATVSPLGLASEEMGLLGGHVETWDERGCRAEDRPLTRSPKAPDARSHAPNPARVDTRHDSSSRSRHHQPFSTRSPEEPADRAREPPTERSPSPHFVMRSPRSAERLRRSPMENRSLHCLARSPRVADRRVKEWPQGGAGNPSRSLTQGGAGSPSGSLTQGGAGSPTRSPTVVPTSPPRGFNPDKESPRNLTNNGQDTDEDNPENATASHVEDAPRDATRSTTIAQEASRNATWNGMPGGEASRNATGLGATTWPETSSSEGVICQSLGKVTQSQEGRSQGSGKTSRVKVEGIPHATVPAPLVAPSPLNDEPANRRGHLGRLDEPRPADECPSCCTLSQSSNAAVWGEQTAQDLYLSSSEFWESQDERRSTSARRPRPVHNRRIGALALRSRKCERGKKVKRAGRSAARIGGLASSSFSFSPASPSGSWLRFDYASGRSRGDRFDRKDGLNNNAATVSLSQARFGYSPLQGQGKSVSPGQGHLLEGVSPCQGHLAEGVSPCQGHLLEGVSHCQGHLVEGVSHCQGHLLEGVSPCQGHLVEGVSPCQSHLAEGVSPCQGHLVEGVSHCQGHLVEGVSRVKVRRPIRSAVGTGKARRRSPSVKLSARSSPTETLGHLSLESISARMIPTPPVYPQGFL